MYDKPTDNEEVGVTLTIPIFDWGLKGKSKIQPTGYGIGRNQPRRTEKEIVIDVRQICRNLPTLIRQIEIKRKALKMRNVPMKSIWKNIATVI